MIGHKIRYFVPLSRLITTFRNNYNIVGLYRGSTQNLRCRARGARGSGGGAFCDAPGSGFVGECEVNGRNKNKQEEEKEIEKRRGVEWR